MTSSDKPVRTTASAHRFPRWLSIVLAVIAAFGAAFGLWLMTDSLRSSDSFDARRVRELNVAADYIAAWPTVAEGIGQSALYDRVPAKPEKEAGPLAFVHLHHPGFGEIRVRYDKDTKACPREVIIKSNRLTVKGEALAAVDRLPDPVIRPYIERGRKGAWFESKPGEAICFTIPDLDLRRIASADGVFANLLLVKADDQAPAAEAGNSKSKDDDRSTSLLQGEVVARIGPAELPIRRLADLPELQNQLQDTLFQTAAAASSVSSGKAVVERKPGPRRDALEPFNSRVAGQDYRFYWRPLTVDARGASEQAGASTRYFLVGVADRSMREGRGETRAVLAGFALLLAILVAMLPVIKLALLGPVDALRPIEVAAVLAGLLTATALATSGLVGGYDLLAARNAARDELEADARKLQRTVLANLSVALASPAIRELATGMRQCGEDRLIDSRPHNGAGLPDIESVFTIDRNGWQPPGFVVRAARDYAGANIDLGDRPYFRRALRGEFASGSGTLLAQLQDAPIPSLWQVAQGGLILDQILSRSDGVPKTILSAPLSATEPTDLCPDQAGKDERLRPAVIVASFVMPDLVGPVTAIARKVGFSIVDLRDADDGWRILLDRDPRLSTVARFGDRVDAASRERLREAARRVPPCRLDGAAGPDQAAPNQAGPLSFMGRFNEKPTFFSAVRVPCTDWLVVTHYPRRQVDAWAVMPAAYAAIAWFGVVVLVYIVWAFAVVKLRERAWCFLWPDSLPQKAAAYRKLSIILAAIGVAGLVLLWLGVAFVFVAVICLLAAVGALAWLYHLHRQLCLGGEGWNRPKIAASTEGRYMCFLVSLLLVVAVVPILSLGSDARLFFRQVAAAQAMQAQIEDEAAQQRNRNSILQVVSVARRKVQAPSEATAGPAAECQARFTCSLRQLAGWGADDRLALPDPRQVARLHVVDILVIVAAGVAFGFVLWNGLDVLRRGVFGFGTPLDALEFPPLPGKDHPGDPSRRVPPWFELDESRLPRRFLMIGSSDAQLAALRRHATELDLFEAIAKKRAFKLPPSRPSWGGQPRLILVTNLGLLLGDPAARREALDLLEHVVAAQGGSSPPPYRIGILTTLSPLDRLLQSIEREREEREGVASEVVETMRRERAKYREDMRWSALLEEFTTFYRAVSRRRVPAGVALDPMAQAMWRELEYLPDHPVAAMIGDARTLQPLRLAEWVMKVTRDAERRGAVKDYLASNMIEHYHLAWSLSGRAERLLLYHFAHGQMPHLTKAYAVRSLIRRGLVVLDPHPRIVNRSFAQFVRHVEKPTTIRRWRLTQENGLWQAMRTLIGLVVPAALAVLLLMSLRSGESITTILPLFVAAGPALLNAFGSGRRNAGG